MQMWSLNASFFSDTLWVPELCCSLSSVILKMSNPDSFLFIFSLALLPLHYRQRQDYTASQLLFNLTSTRGETLALQNKNPLVPSLSHLCVSLRIQRVKDPWEKTGSGVSLGENNRLEKLFEGDGLFSLPVEWEQKNDSWAHMKPIALSRDFCFHQRHLIMSEMPV